MRYNKEDSITCYNDFIDKSDIGEIVITNQRKKQGFLRFKKNPFYYTISSPHSKDPNKECLKLWIKHRIIMNDTSIRGKQKLLNHIIETTYNPDFKQPIPEKYEIFLSANRNDYMYFNYNTGIIIPPSKSNIFYKSSDIYSIGDTYKPIINIFNINDIDTCYIEYILNKIVNVDDIKDMKMLIHNFLFKIDKVINISFKNRHHFDIIEIIKCIFLQQIHTNSNHYHYKKYEKNIDINIDINIEDNIMIAIKNELTSNNISFKDTDTLNNIILKDNDTSLDYINKPYFRFKLFCFLVKSTNI
jgi:hypothetical protein